jgi:hypothetical protein
VCLDLRWVIFFLFTINLPSLQALGLGGSAVVLTSKAEMAYSYQQNAQLAYRLAKQVYAADPFDERSASLCSSVCVVC